MRATFEKGNQGWGTEVVGECWMRYFDKVPD